MSDFSQGPGWWMASDGKWYPPQSHAPPPVAPTQWTYPGPGGYVPPPSLNVFSIVALVCSIMWGFGVLSILAVVFGIVALRQIGAKGERGRGLALAGIIVGALGILGAIGTVAILATIGDKIADIDKTAIVRVQADEDVCWIVTITNSSRQSDEPARDIGCGSAAFSMGKGFDREAVVTKRTGSGSVTAVVTVEGDERDRGTVDSNLESVTVSP